MESVKWSDMLDAFVAKHAQGTPYIRNVIFCQPVTKTICDL